MPIKWKCHFLYEFLPRVEVRTVSLEVCVPSSVRIPSYFCNKYVFNDSTMKEDGHPSCRCGCFVWWIVFYWCFKVWSLRSLCFCSPTLTPLPLSYSQPPAMTNSPALWLLDRWLMTTLLLVNVVWLCLVPVLIKWEICNWNPLKVQCFHSTVCSAALVFWGLRQTVALPHLLTLASQFCPNHMPPNQLQQTR